ncbi:hypothetical protein M422DRAFT_275832 [Sphaerobolus stellatus SS14]|uniref:Uncharacterized protein n=1 Tax=Sphaerobolus stellatus (strain SS14) TaxID=990650 RepID=A0A0C9T3W8_SPHS4|nr:hypothetical protein M422DRAFT_275832 [Sphaerobolus stellatus SS14]
MCHIWQSVVDTYWEVVREWIVAKMKEWLEVIARQEEREEEANRLKKMAGMKRDERVKKKLEERKQKRLEKDVGDLTKKKKKYSQNPKSVPTMVELDEDRDREVRIITANRKMLLERGIDIVEEDSLQASHM